MHEIMGSQFIELTWSIALQVTFLGFIGGMLSGFIGSGGAFFMTPGMMNLGVMGNVAVASNITHKFGKALIGSKKHAELGNVDKKLSIFMAITGAVGIQLAAWLVELMSGGGDSHEGGAGVDLYISVVFVVVLSLVSLSMLKDIMNTRKGNGTGPSTKIVDFLGKFNIPPMIHFQVADVKVSLWVVLICGLATGYLAGTIGVGGFIGVPAMIYVFGVSASVAAGSELFLAQFNGAFGALTYAFKGMVDIRLVLLLFAGSLFGIYIGAYGTKVVKEIFIRMVTALIILLCVLSRLVNIPAYMQQLGYLDIDASSNHYFELASKILLYASGITGGALILVFVLKAYFQRRKIQTSLTTGVVPRESGSPV
ncbi:MAG: sulfite exporter TauE/SafE family protein [Acidobacteriota bacterium]